MASISRISLRMIFGSFERCTECAIRTSAALTTCLATSLSNARAEASAPGPVKAMWRASSMRWMVPSSPSPPWSASRYTREGWLSNAATTEGKLRRSCGKEVALEGSLKSCQLLAPDAVDRPRRSEEPGLRLVEHRRDVLRGRDRDAPLVAGPSEEDDDVGAGHST